MSHFFAICPFPTHREKLSNSASTSARPSRLKAWPGRELTDLASQFFRIRNEIADATVDPGFLDGFLDVEGNSNDILKIRRKWIANSKPSSERSILYHPVGSLGSLQGGEPAPSVTTWRFGQWQWSCSVWGWTWLDHVLKDFDDLNSTIESCQKSKPSSTHEISGESTFSDQTCIR